MTKTVCDRCGSLISDAGQVYTYTVLFVGKSVPGKIMKSIYGDPMYAGFDLCADCRATLAKVHQEFVHVIPDGE